MSLERIDAHAMRDARSIGTESARMRERRPEQSWCRRDGHSCGASDKWQESRESDGLSIARKRAARRHSEDLSTGPRKKVISRKLISWSESGR